ncbi:hypothetical protein GUJ93_ZPchr0012g18826 [Zizania palustris]|uniref:Uncharacterized protein n=1 Tax=Zizania palustris TaxID=103762 RepID=A0A8J5WU71_ZIZPA|nr:hypothetical protein GUJ93_ZPchr0012g18826 [Zizania palustris]
MRGHDTWWDIGVSAVGLFPACDLHDVLVSGCLRMRKVAKRMARAFVAALSDIDNTSSEDPSSDEDEPDKKDKKMKDFSGLSFMANYKQSSDEPGISEGGDADRLSTAGDRGSSG